MTMFQPTASLPPLKNVLNSSSVFQLVNPRPYKAAVPSTTLLCARPSGDMTVSVTSTQVSAGLRDDTKCAGR